MPRRTAGQLAGLIVLAVAVTVFVLAFAHRDPKAPSAGAATSQPADCGARLILDWRDGRIDRTYPISCYLRAERTLPTDLRVYSSAADDIRQALAKRVTQGAVRRPAG